MSAYCYIELTDVPLPLIASSVQRAEEVTGAALIGFDGCPLIGRIETHDGKAEVEFPFPRAIVIRNDLVAWLVHWGICFRVVM
jgi:hypothetical protein